MALIESFEDIPERGPPRLVGQELEATVVRLTGEHDLSTVAELSATLARAIALDDTDLVLDLSGIAFMDASTVRVMLRAQGFLIRRGRSLRLRSPATCARLVLKSSGLAAHIERDLEGSDHATPPSGALATWVDVPVTDVSPPSAAEPAPVPSSRPVEGA